MYSDKMMEDDVVVEGNTFFGAHMGGVTFSGEEVVSEDNMYTGANLTHAVWAASNLTISDDNFAGASAQRMRARERRG